MSIDREVNVVIFQSVDRCLKLVMVMALSEKKKERKERKKHTTRIECLDFIESKLILHRETKAVSGINCATSFFGTKLKSAVFFFF